jgi:hypothetical protein
VCKESVILICDNPYNQPSKRIIPRYELDGGLNILFEKNQIIIEHVGQGFDPGDITKGKSVHNRITIPSEIIYESTKEIYKYLKYVCRNSIWHISNSQYTQERENRIQELTTTLDIHAQNIRTIIPTEPQTINLSFINNIFENCINKIIYSGINIDKPFSIVVNIYNNMFSVFEIWQIKRSWPLV